MYDIYQRGKQTFQNQDLGAADSIRKEVTKRQRFWSSRYFYAKLGRDVPSQFEGVTYDFRAMTLSLE